MTILEIAAQTTCESAYVHLPTFNSQVFTQFIEAPRHFYTRACESRRRDVSLVTEIILSLRIALFYDADYQDTVGILHAHGPNPVQDSHLDLDADPRNPALALFVDTTQLGSGTRHLGSARPQHHGSSWLTARRPRLKGQRSLSSHLAV